MNHHHHFQEDSKRQKEQSKYDQNGATRHPKRSVDGARGHDSGELRALIRRSTMGFYSQSFRFEGVAGDKREVGLSWRLEDFGRSHLLTPYDFVVGLNRTGKSCRLRWVNYLHPGLKRGKMTPQEERLVLELHAKWGNRWSRIAGKLPGRTDNEIKNYWRTHMRKKAQEKKKATSSSSSSSTSSSSSSSSTGKVSFYDTGGRNMKANYLEDEKVYSMDDIWKDIDMSEENTIKPWSDNYSEASCNFFCPSMDYYSNWNSLWKIDEEESKLCFFECGASSLTS